MKTSKPTSTIVGLILLVAVAMPLAADERYVEVSATGEARAVPDMASFVVGMQSQRDTAQAALAESNAVLRRLLDVLEGAGIAPADVQTRQFAVHPQFDNNRAGDAPALVGYRVHNELHVLVDDVQKLGELLDASLRAGANEISGVQFGTRDPAEVVARARSAAMAEARARATQLARLAGVELGEVQRIVESHGGGPMPAGGVMMARSEAFSSVPVAGGSERHSVSVEVRYALR